MVSKVHIVGAKCSLEILAGRQLNLVLSHDSAKTAMESIFKEQVALHKKEERKVRGRAALKKFREKEKREKLERERKSEHLRKENQDISTRTAVYQEVMSVSC